MNANELIESYVTDVAVHLPRQQRDDVAFELRALLNEELQAKAESAGREPDADMATELLRGFGRPAEVAARYRPPLTIIDPADGRAFLRASVIGLAILWALGLVTQVQGPFDSVGDFFLALGRWWGNTLIGSLWWPGLLVVGFGLAAWGRRRNPQAAEWKPRSPDRLPGGRVGMVMGLLGTLVGLLVLRDPRWLLDVAFGGRAAPAAYEALTYTQAFRDRQGLVLFVLLVLDVPLLVAAIVNGRKSTIMRRVELEMSLIMSAALVWAIVGGPIFESPVSNQMAKGILSLIALMTLIDLGVRLYRSVRPAPGRKLA